MAIIYDKPKAPKPFVKKPSLCSQHKAVFIHPAQRLNARKDGKSISGQIATSWPTNNAK